MSEIVKERQCKQAQCPVHQTGECLEGLQFESCSHFFWGNNEMPEEPLEDDERGKATANNVSLFKGTELTLEELTFITHKYETNLVIIIGDSNSGKTTLLTSIFDLFQLGEFKNLSFAGSLTQVGFETRCHLSRAASKANIPETARTGSVDFNFLHLAYKNKNHLDNDATHVLISDISGERFNLAMGSSSAMKELILLKVSNHLLYLLDGDKIGNKFERGALLNRTSQFITRALDTAVFSNRTSITIVFTKVDQLLVQENATETIESIKTYFVDKFKGKLKSIKFHLLASRPKPPTSDFRFGHGVEELVQTWKNLNKSSDDFSLEMDLTSDRFFNKYKVAYE